MYPGSYTEALHRHVVGGLKRTDRRRRGEPRRETCVEQGREADRWM